MAFLALDHKHRVLYSCFCSQLSPLSELYFCRHCKVQRCRDCVSSVIDSFSCPHCFESAPLSEAKNRKNRCNHCFQCPQCASTLTTRSVIVPSEVLGDQSPQKRDRTQAQPATGGTSPAASSRSSSSLKSPGGTKAYFLCCTHCKWSTRDVSIGDKRSPMDFKDRPSPHQDRITELIAYYKEFALRDKAEREKAKRPGRRMKAYGSLLDPSRFSIGKLGGPESPSPPRRVSCQLTWDASLPEKMAGKATDSPSPPPDDLYAAPIKLEETTSLNQRFLDPTFQPAGSDALWPRPLHMIGKKLHRCKGCDHILLKAEMNPSSIRFKIQQVALHTFPQVRIWEYPTLEAGKPCEVLLSVTNPVNYTVTVSFEQYTEGSDATVKGGNVLPVVLPEGEFTLTPNDDVVDLLEDMESEMEDNPQYVHSRLPGKLVLKFTIVPVNIREDSKFMFKMNFTHKSTVESDHHGEVDTVHVPVLVNAGRTPSS